MRPLAALGVCLLVVLTPRFAMGGLAPAQAARPVEPQSGALKGQAKDPKGRKLPNANVRVRNTVTGAIVAEVVADAAGAFSIGALAPATYVVEVVSVTGQVVGVSSAVAVTAATTATVTVAATAAGTIAAAAAGSGLSLLGLGTAASAAVVTAAGAAAVVAVQATRPEASPSR